MNKSELNSIIEQPMTYAEIATLNEISQLGKEPLETLSIAFCYGKKQGMEVNNNA